MYASRMPEMPKSTLHVACGTCLAPKSTYNHISIHIYTYTYTYTCTLTANI